MMQIRTIGRRDFIRKSGCSAAYLALLSTGAYGQTEEPSKVRIPLDSGLGDITQGDFAVETWFRTTDPGRHILVGNFNSAYPGVLNLELHTENRARVYLQSSDGQLADLNQPADLLGIDTRDGTWRHLAAVRSEGWISLYLDGRKLGVTLDTTATHPRSAVGPMVSDRTLPLKAETMRFAGNVPSPTGVKQADQVEFGVISDIHYGVLDWKWPGTGHVEYEFVEQFLADMTATKADFIIQLGDFCKKSDDGQRVFDLWNRFDGPVHNVLGNHERDGGSSFDEVAEWWGMPHRYYTFDSGRMRGIILDGNEPGGGGPGYAAFVGPEQRAWLQRQLAETDRPVIIFIHQPIEHGLRNGDEVRAILEAAEAARPGTIIAVIAGHAHKDYAVTINTIPYIQINSASYKWYDPAGGPIRYAAPVWGRVHVDFDTGLLRITGRESDWLETDPWRHGATDGAFALQGGHLYLGRDTRMGATRMVGELDHVRLWQGGLWDDAIAALAAGGQPADLSGPRGKMMAEYRFETSGGSRLRHGDPLSGVVDDSAGFAGGPFHGVAAGQNAPRLIADVPGPLRSSQQSTLAVRFNE